MSVDRRTFLKGAALASAAAAAPAVLVAAAERTPARTAPVWQKAPCNLCGVGCGLLVGIQGGRAVAVKGDPDSPVSRGLACVKGYHSIQALYARDRITRARVRRDGVLVDVPLAEAYDVVAARLRETIAQHGRASVGVYGSGEWSVSDAYVATKLFKGGIGSNNVDTSARLHTASARAGLHTSYGADGAVGGYEDIDHADVFVLWDHNMAETDPVLFSRLLERRRRDPAVRIITVGTRTTRTCYAADRALLHVPDTGIALAHAICHELVARRRVNSAFIERHVAFRRGGTGGATSAGIMVEDDVVESGYDEYVRFLRAYTPELAQQLAGLPADDIRWLASLYGDPSRRVLSVWGDAVNGSVRGTWLNNVLHNIHLLTGRTATPGSGALCLAGESGGSDGVHAAGATPDGLPQGSVRVPADRQLAARVWGVAPDRIPETPGRSALSLFSDLGAGGVRFLWIQATNPLASLPNARRHREATRGGGTFIVVSDAFPTATTDVADVVLPAALWLERDGIAGNAERRTQHWARLLSSPGDAAADGWHMIEVARRLGLGALFPWQQATYVDAAWHELARFHDDAQRRPAVSAELRAQPGVQWPVVDGRATRWRYNVDHDPAADRAYGGYDFYGHPDHRAWIWLRPHEPAVEGPDSEYPFRLAVGRVLEHSGTGTLTRRIPTLHRALPRAYAELNADDARALGIRNGDAVRLVTRRGAITLGARVDYRAQPQPGQVFVPYFDESAPVNLLTLDTTCPLSGQPGSGMCAVRVERAAATAVR